MTISSIYAGAEQCDIAMLENLSGVTLWCFVWLAAGGQRIEAKVIAETEDGALVLVDAAVVATPVGTFVDCPRVLAVEDDEERYFIVHWIDANTGSETYNLWRARFDAEAISTGWNSLGAQPLYSTLQYDAVPVVGSEDGHFVVVRRTAAGSIAMERYISPFSWVDTDWAETMTGLTIGDTVLGAYAYENESVVVAFQSGTELASLRRNAVDGQDAAVDVLLGDVEAGANLWTAVAFTRFSAAEYLVVAEGNTNANNAAGGYLDYARFIAWGRVVPDSGVQAGDSQWCWNLHMLSRPWSWASGVTLQPEIYVAVSFKSIADGQEFDQQFGYVVRLDYAATVLASGNTVRPIPCTALMSGSVDARPHGLSPASAVTDISIGCRLNHLPHVAGPPRYTLGPNVSSRMFTCTRWGRLKASQDADAGSELQPVEAGVGWVRFHHEPAWTVRRDASQPTQPDTPAWRGASRALSLPVETPAGLVLSGGVTQAYDGEQLVELGFMWSPEIVNIAVAGMGGAATDLDGLTYYYYANYVWPDNRGGVHRSGPSRPVAAVLTDNDVATLRVRCCNLSMKDDRERYPTCAPIAVEIWRTYAVGGDLDTDSVGTYLFRAIFGGAVVGSQELQDIPSSDPGAFVIEVTDEMSNAVIANNQLAPYQLDPTSLQWVPPPPTPHQPSAAATLWQNRLFVYDGEDRSIAWSEEILPLGNRYEWPYFLDTNRFRADAMDRIVAMVPLESDLVLLTRESISSISGDPGAGGSGNTFQVRSMARGIGTIEPRSIAIVTDGFTFQSAKGRVHLFTRGSGLEDIGAPIEDLLRQAGNVRSAVYLEDRDEVRFLLQEEPGTGPLLIRPRIAIYNLRTRVWVIRNLPMGAQSSTASRLNEVMHGAAWRGRQGETIHVVLVQGGLFLERASTSTNYNDDSASGSVAVRLDCTTEWIHLGLDATKRYHEIGIQTERLNAGPLTVEAWYDHDGSWDSDDGAAQQTLTVASPAPDFIRFRPTQGKCRGIKLRIYEPSGAAGTENVRLVALVVHYSMKKQRQGSRNNAA